MKPADNDSYACECVSGDVAWLSVVVVVVVMGVLNE